MLIPVQTSPETSNPSMSVKAPACRQATWYVVTGLTYTRAPRGTSETKRIRASAVPFTVALIIPEAYIPGATYTVAPGTTRRAANGIVRHGFAADPSFASFPLGDTWNDGPADRGGAASGTRV